MLFRAKSQSFHAKIKIQSSKLLLDPTVPRGKKISFLPWFVTKTRGDSLATVAEGNLCFISGGTDCKSLSLSLYLHFSPVKWA